MKVLNVGASFVMVAAALVAAPTPSAAATISINNLLKNGSFESGVSTTCPTDWACVNLVGVNEPTAAQYPGSNGLPVGTVPDGRFAAFTPLSPNSNGTLRQTISGQQYVAGNSYELSFWLGNPSGGLFPSRVDVQLLAGAFNGGATNSLCDTAGRNSTLVSGPQSGTDNGEQCSYSITGPESGVTAGLWQPADGDWRFYTLTFSTNATITGDIGVQFNIFGQQSASNGTLMHLDIPGIRTTNNDLAAVPEPATLTLLGLGLLGASRKRLFKK